MRIVINGKNLEVEEPCSVATVLRGLDLAPVRVAVERNETLVPRKDFAATTLQPGDRLEIVTLVGGG